MSGNNLFTNTTSTAKTITPHNMATLPAEMSFGCRHI